MAAGTTKKPMTKTELYTTLAEQTGVTRKQVSQIFDAMSGVVKKSLGKSGPGVFTLPGLLKIERQRKPARPARKGVPNPFRPGELMDVPAKPATNKVKVRALKNLKAMV